MHIYLIIGAIWAVATILLMVLLATGVIRSIFISLVNIVLFETYCFLSIGNFFPDWTNSIKTEIIMFILILVLFINSSIIATKLNEFKDNDHA